jgi:hypothetical protein
MKGMKAASGLDFPSKGVDGRGHPSVAAVAVAGVVVGHLITYVLLLPRPSDRAIVLRDTGHAYFPAVLQAALLVGALSLGSWFLRTVIGRERSAPSSSTLFARLARLQLAGFAAMEVVERIASGTPLVELLRDHIVVGLAVQLVIAWLAARFLAALARAAERIRGAGAEGRPARAVIPFPLLRGDVRGGLVRGTFAARAPPCAICVP